VENDISPELIQERMQRTRDSLTDKVAQLEEQVIGTVQTATDAMQSTVDTVKDTVDDVRSSVAETVSTVKETVRQTFDVSSHVRERPWLMLGAAVATGFVTSRVVFGHRAKSETRSGEREAESTRSRFVSEPSNFNPPAAPASKAPSWYDRLMTRVGDELYNLGETAMNQAIEALRTSTNEGVPRLISEVEHLITGNGRTKVKC